MFELVVVAENEREVALHIFFEAGDGDDVEFAAGVEVGVGVVEENGEQFGADFGRHVGDNEVEFLIVGDVAEAV